MLISWAKGQEEVGRSGRCLAAMMALAGSMLLLGQDECGPTETCDGLDNDADGQVDEDFDADSDGYASLEVCGPVYGSDCDDTDAAINPGVEEVPRNGIDDDCDLQVDEDAVISPLYSLNDSEDEGSRVEAAVIEGSDGHFYGAATYGGGANDGTLFRISPAGEYEHLIKFSSTAGCQPSGRLLEASDGAIYGVTLECGRTETGISGHGTLYRWSETAGHEILRVFTAGSNNIGYYPRGGLVEVDGFLYGTTSSGGNYVCTGSSCADNGGGTLYRLNPTNGRVVVMAVFGSGATGYGSYGTPVWHDGALYGVNGSGGRTGGGTLWRCTAEGECESLHHFSYSDGASSPRDGLTVGSNGWLYGTGVNGAPAGDGGVYRFHPDGRFELLHSFDYDAGDLYWPMGWVTEGPDGDFYGTTAGEVMSGTYICDQFVPGSCGGIFKLSPEGGYQILDIFSVLPSGDPHWLFGGFEVASDGRLYTGSTAGGEYSSGMIFSIDPMAW